MEAIRFGQPPPLAPALLASKVDARDVTGPAVQFSTVFLFQSFFDSTLLEKAILQQNAAEPIVSSTLVQQQVKGYQIGLHPSSQTPIAFEVTSDGGSSRSQTYILKPGEIKRPLGNEQFSGVRFGLPFGWLGGGLVNVVIFQTKESDAIWGNDGSELIFHRQRMKIQKPADAPTNAPKNWPMRFPWTQALFGTSSVPQQGNSVMAITKPSRILMSLRLTSLANPATMRILWQSSNDFDLNQSGNIVATGVRFYEYVWGSYTVSGIAAGNLQNSFPLVGLDDLVARLAADDGGVQLIDMSGGTLDDQLVDVVRYGYL